MKDNELMSRVRSMMANNIMAKLLDDTQELIDRYGYDGAEDYRLFCRGEALECIERDKLYFPELSHA